MCGRFSLKSSDIIKLAKRFLAEPDEEAFKSQKPRYNIAPTQGVFTIIGSKERKLTTLRWGLIPSWAKDATVGFKMINARGETLAEKPSFRSLFKKSRCMILADSFYEWMKTPSGKQPVRILLKSGEPFAFAGLWSTWTDPESKEEVRTCTIVTTSPNALLQKVHDRMPVILSPEGEDKWMAADSSESDLLGLLRPYPESEMEFYPVSPRINSGRADDEDLIRPVDAVPKSSDGFLAI